MNLSHSTLTGAAKGLRVLSTLILNWPSVLALFCVISPISLHMKIPYELSHGACQYLGTRGLIAPGRIDCPPIALIDTRERELVSLDDLSWDKIRERFSW